jgi:hypothetical protein
VLASVQGRSTAEVAAMFAATTQYQRRDRAVDDWCTTNDVGLVFTPTQASWLNWIESEFTALRYFTVDGSDYLPIHAAQEADRRLHPVDEPARDTETSLRSRVQDPQTRLPTERCLTRH